MKFVLTLVATTDALAVVSRRSVLSVAAFPGVAAAEQMKTSNDFANYEALTGEARSANLGPGTISGKSRPETGVILSGPPETSGDSIFADVVLNGGVSARVAFSPASGVKLAKGMYYDVEARSKQGDSSYLQVVPGTRDAASLVDAVMRPDGRYGAFGQPTDVRVVSDEWETDARRLIDVSFSAVAPGGSTTPRRATLAIVTATGSTDVLMLVSSSGEARWRNGGDLVARQAATSFRVDATRPTKLAATKASDFRFEERGGFRGLLDSLGGSDEKLSLLRLLLLLWSGGGGGEMVSPQGEA